MCEIDRIVSLVRNIFSASQCVYLSFVVEKNPIIGNDVICNYSYSLDDLYWKSPCWNIRGYSELGSAWGN